MEEMVIASSSVDAGISCRNLRTGEEQLRYRSCISTSHGLTCVGGRFLACSQLRSSSSSSGSILYWSWNKPQPEVKSFPAEPINPLVSNNDGTYIAGGGLSGYIYLWEVTSGRLLKKWHAHYRAVTCLVFSDDESLLISGAEDGCVRIWSLFKLFDAMGDRVTGYLYEHSFSEHTLCVTDVVSGYGGSNAIIVSSSEDRTCMIWSLSKGRLLRTITFPSVIDAIALDPGEHAFYAGCRDGKIYIAALTAESTYSSSYGTHIIGLLSDNSKAVTCLAFSMDGTSLISGSEDGILRVWDIKTHHVIRVSRHAKGPINNVLVLRQPIFSSPQSSVNAHHSISRRHVSSLLPPSLDKYVNSDDGHIDTKSILQPACDESTNIQYLSSQVMTNQITELQQQSSSAASEMELERLRLDCQRSLKMVNQWKKMYQDLLHECVDELPRGDANGKA